MGRFTSVQAYADNNSNLRKLTYEQAVGGGSASGSNSNSNKNNAAGSSNDHVVAGEPTSSATSRGSVKTEKVVNPYGSTAGAGSGEFHVYRHARAREMERWKELDQQEREQDLDEQFRLGQQRNLDEVQSKTSKNRKKRQREKDAKRRKKHLKAAGIYTNCSSTVDGVGGDDNKNGNREGEEEFQYIPIAKQRNENETKGVNDGPTAASTDSAKPAVFVGKSEIRNDGSFLDMVKQKLASSNAALDHHHHHNNSEDKGPNGTTKNPSDVSPSNIAVSSVGPDAESRGRITDGAKTSPNEDRRKGDTSVAVDPKSSTVAETKIIDEDENDDGF